VRIGRRSLFPLRIFAKVNVVRSKESDSFFGRTFELSSLGTKSLIRSWIVKRIVGNGQAVGSENDFGTSRRCDPKLLWSSQDQVSSRTRLTKQRERLTSLTSSMRGSFPVSIKQVIAIPICWVWENPGWTSTSPIFFAWGRRVPDVSSNQSKECRNLSLLDKREYRRHSKRKDLHLPSASCPVAFLFSGRNTVKCLNRIRISSVGQTSRRHDIPRGAVGGALEQLWRTS